MSVGPLRPLAALIVPLFLLTARHSYADTETPLFTAQRDACDIRATATLEGRTIIFRVARHAGGTQTCVVTPNDTAGLVTLAFSTIELQQLDKEGDAYRSIFLGRLIDYEWLNRHLSKHAERDADWSAAIGKAKNGERAEAYVMRVLHIRAVLDPLDEALKPYGYLAQGFSCEKAMVSGPDTLQFQPAWVAADKRLPFDALCHLVLKPLQ
jgi:hypothetical protein